MSKNVKNLSKEERIKNSYESIYHKVESNDPEMDKILKDAMQNQFLTYDLVLADLLDFDKDIEVDDEQFRQMLVGACFEACDEIDGVDMTHKQMKIIEEDFNNFTQYNPSVYETIFDNFEEIYEGETIDFHADYVRAYGSVGSNMAKVITEDLDDMYEAFKFDSKEARDVVRDSYGDDSVNDLSDTLKFNTLRNINKVSSIDIRETMDESIEDNLKYIGSEPTASDKMKLSYKHNVPEATVRRERRLYSQVKEEDKIASELKGSDFDKSYDDYIKGTDTHQKFTAGDSYGFDEPEDEDELEL